MGAEYSYLFADLVTGDVLDELPLVGVSFEMALGEPGTFRGTLPVADPLVPARQPHRLTEPARTAVYVERAGTLVWGGIVWTSRYEPAERTLEIRAADFLSYFAHRTVQSVPPGDPVEFEAPPIRIARSLLELAATHPGGDLGLRIVETVDGDLGPSRRVGYGPDDLKPVDEALADLAENEGGFELASDVAYGPGGRPERRIMLGRPRLGQPGSAHVWEFGANMTDLTWPRDGSTMATRVFVKGAQGDDGTLLAGEEDPQAYPDGWPLLEAVVSHSDVQDEDLLAGLARAELSARRRPVVLPELVVRADLDPVLGRYSVGDDARIVIDDPFLGDPGGFSGFDGMVRIVGIDVTPGDDAGAEEVKLTVTPVGSR